ncbi:MAG: hypothetical protein GX058_08715 [Firmicutes bacterium]|nr:hypothetical protein [Bacillota bacterium]
MGKGKYLKYGGVKFYAKVPETEINEYVLSLPEEQRKSLYDVVIQLRDRGMIEIDEEDITTIDKDMLPFLQSEETEID